MSIQRTTLKPAGDAQSDCARPDFASDRCLDCATCNGLCWSLAEMAFIPDRILKSDRTARV